MTPTRGTPTGILTAALACAALALPASALAGAPIPGASYMDKPKGKVQTINISVDETGKRIVSFAVDYVNECHSGIASAYLAELKIKPSGKFKAKNRVPSPAGKEIVKARGAFSGDGRTVRGRWSYRETGPGQVCAARAKARFEARTKTKPVEDAPPPGTWTGMTEEEAPHRISFEVEDGKRLADITFQATLDCYDENFDHSNVVYDGVVADAALDRFWEFEAREGTVSVRGGIERRGSSDWRAYGYITVEETQIGSADCSASHVDFVATPAGSEARR